MTDNSKATEVFAGQLWQATMIKNMLEENGIAAFLNNEFLSVAAPYLADAGGMPHVQVVVNDTQKEAALKLIAEFNAGLPGE